MAGKPTRAERFRLIRDAVMAALTEWAGHPAPACHLVCADFLLSYRPPGTMPGHSYHALDIWPERRLSGGFYEHGHKVANVKWRPEDDGVGIVSYHSGPWEERLLAALQAGDCQLLKPSESPWEAPDGGPA